MLQIVEPTVAGFLFVSILLFAAGVAGAVGKRSVASRLACADLAAAAALLNLVAFSKFWRLEGVESAYQGEAFAVLAGVAVVAQAVVGVAMTRRPRGDSGGSPDPPRGG